MDRRSLVSLNPAVMCLTFCKQEASWELKISPATGGGGWSWDERVLVDFGTMDSLVKKSRTPTRGTKRNLEALRKPNVYFVLLFDSVLFYLSSFTQLFYLFFGLYFLLLSLFLISCSPSCSGFLACWCLRTAPWVLWPPHSRCSDGIPLAPITGWGGHGLFNLHPFSSIPVRLSDE